MCYRVFLTLGQGLYFQSCQELPQTTLLASSVFRMLGMKLGRDSDVLGITGAVQLSVSLRAHPVCTMLASSWY